MSEMLGDQHAEYLGAPMKVVKDASGATETFVKCEIHGRWFWLKVENREAYLNIYGRGYQVGPAAQDAE